MGKMFSIIAALLAWLLIFPKILVAEFPGPEEANLSLMAAAEKCSWAARSPLQQLGHPPRQ